MSPLDMRKDREQQKRLVALEAEVQRLRGLLTLWLNVAPADVREVMLNGTSLGELTKAAFDEERDGGAMTVPHIIDTAIAYLIVAGTVLYFLARNAASAIPAQPRPEADWHRRTMYAVMTRDAGPLFYDEREAREYHARVPGSTLERIDPDGTRTRLA